MSAFVREIKDEWNEKWIYPHIYYTIERAKWKAITAILSGKKADTFSLFLGIKTTLDNGDRKQSPAIRIREI